MFFVFGSAIVVVKSVMAERASPKDLIYGTVRKPAAPLAVGHDKLVSRLHSALDAYVTSRSLGRLWVGVEIVLDRREGIVLQPDITFIVDGRESIVSDRVWGPPDMVLEVTSTLTHSAHLEERVAWFSLYGVREVLAGAAGAEGNRGTRACAWQRPPPNALRRHHARQIAALARVRSMFRGVADVARLKPSPTRSEKSFRGLLRGAR